MTNRPWAPAAACALAYCAVTAVLGRDVLAHLSTTVVHDVGDPLLTAAILHWNAWTLPLTHAWWQFPIFYPTADALAFSEHLLGLSVIATPVAWLTRDPLVTANLTTLLTFPLSAIAAYLLARRLHAGQVGAFVAGLAYGFAPYRIGQLPHVQMLAAFWAPLSLVGLHAYLDTGRRRWLVLYAVAWLLQVTANGYTLLVFSLLVGLWVAWFVILPRRWGAFAGITVATACAGALIAPVLWTYRTVHARHGFTRTFDNIQHFGADLFGVLCAPADLSFWGWLRVTCRGEGELFPGLVLSALTVAALVWLLRDTAPRSEKGRAGRRWRGAVRVPALIAIGAASAALVGLLIAGPWRFDVGPLRVSANSADKPLLALVLGVVVMLATSRGVFEAVRRGSVPGFYLVAAGVSWLLALGPVFIVLGEPRGVPGPYRLLMYLPGGDSFRVPARFWLMTVLCLSVVAGLVVSEVLRRRRGAAAGAIALILSAGVLSDGWVARIPVVAAPPTLPDQALARGGVVLALPAGSTRDYVPQYLAVIGGWKTVNGFSGYEPKYYEAIRQGVRYEVDGLFAPFRARTDLHVVVAPDDERLRPLVERQPGARQTGESGGMMQFLLPRQPGAMPAAVSTTGVVVPIARVESSCASTAALAADGDIETVWSCAPQQGHETFTVVLRETAVVSSLRYTLGRAFEDFPRVLVVETSLDGVTWEEAWNGDVIAPVIEGGLAEPRRPVMTLPLTPRRARSVRLRQTGQDEDAKWSIAELEILGDSRVEPGKTY